MCAMPARGFPYGFGLRRSGFSSTATVASGTLCPTYAVDHVAYSRAVDYLSLPLQHTYHMPSFDVVSEVNQVEVRNALDQANKEISTRFDFKGSDARVEHKEKELTLYADDDYKLKQVTDVLLGKLTKRSVDVRALKFGNVEKISGDKIKQVATLRVGIEQELAKNIVKQIKDSKLKVQASIQGDAVRVSGAKRDELQNAIALVKKTVTDFPVQFGNFRD